MWDGLLLELLRRGVRTGRLHLTLPDGSQHDIGPGGPPEVAVTLSEVQLAEARRRAV